MFRVTKRVEKIEYAIRDLAAYAQKLENAGRTIIYLNIGDPVKFDFDTPKHIKQALKKAVDEGDNWYAPSEGLLELREAICEKERKVNGVEIIPENVIVTQGTSEAIQMLMAAIIDYGDEILVPSPTYSPYLSYANLFGGKATPYETVEDSGWQPNIDDIRSKITAKTRGIVLVNPNNPTGALYPEKIVKEIVNLAGEYKLLLISDEIYDRIVYEGEFLSTAHISKDVPVVGMNGFSKTYRMTGWRLGYMYFYDPKETLGKLVECVEKETRIRLSANTPAQRAGVAALKGPQNHILDMVNKLRERRDYSCKRLSKMNGISCVKPEGAFYVFPKVEAIGSRWKSDEEFVRHVLQETGVLLVPGSGFNPTCGSGHFRLVILPPIKTLEMAFNKIEQFISS
jgi:aspartate/methionine/tyrosine aminotransferase